MRKKSKETLVTDQPGRKIFFSGLILSCALGFFIRGLTKPELLQAELKSAVDRIHTSTQVDWGGVSFSLKNGWWPRFSILINDIKIVSLESCWGEPLLYAREIELPISFTSFFEKGQPLKKIYIRDAFLEFKSNFVCEKKGKPTAVAISSENIQSIRLRPMKDSPTVPPLVLTDFVFENLKLRQADWVFPDWNFNTLELNAKENRPWYVEVSSNFNIPGMDGVDTGAELAAVYKEFPAQVLEVKIKGHWREGAFQVKGLWEGAQKSWTYQSKFDHIPFQFLRTIAKKTKTPWNWPDKPMWFSFSTQTLLPFTRWESSQHFVKELEVEGDLGELTIPDLEIKSWKPFKVQPFAFKVQHADLNAVFEKDLKKVNFLESFGKLSGQGQWSSERDVLFTGKVEQIQIPVFHREQKMVQLVKSLDLQAELKSGQWKMTSQKWLLDKGLLNGSFRLEGNQDLSTGQVQLGVDSFKMDSDLLKFMEIITPDLQVVGKINSRWKNSHVQDFSGLLKTDLIETRVFELEKPIFNLKRSPLTWDLKIQASQLKIRELSFAALDPNDSSQLKFPYESKAMNALIQLDLGQNLKWNLSSLQIKSSGTVDQSGGLKGTLSLGPKNQEKSLQLTGSRKNPQFLLLR